VDWHRRAGPRGRFQRFGSGPARPARRTNCKRSLPDSLFSAWPVLAIPRSRALGEGEPRSGHRRNFARNGARGVRNFGRQSEFDSPHGPKPARLRREKPKNFIVHRDDLTKNEITIQEGLPLTTISKTVTDLLASGGRIDLLTQAVSDACREGYIGDAEASRLRPRI
jgi:hypothetical protein